MATTTLRLSVKFSWWVNPLMAVLTFFAPGLGVLLNEVQVERVCGKLAQFTCNHGMKVGADGGRP